MHAFRCVSASCVLAAFALAQSASVTYYGLTCGPQPPSGSPKISVVGLPKLGSTIGISQRGVAVQVFQGCRWFGGEALALGTSRTQAFGIPLPFLIPFSLTEGFSCFVWTSSDLILPLAVIGDGRSITIPNDTRLIGMHVHLQWFVYYRNDGVFCSPYFERWMTSDCADLLIGT